MRIVPFGMIRFSLSQEAMAINSSPDGLFPEPGRVADALCQHLRRYVRLIEL
jgi:hypothetical protein